jgi:hypothetical protein
MLIEPTRSMLIGIIPSIHFFDPAIRVSFLGRLGIKFGIQLLDSQDNNGLQIECRTMESPPEAEYDAGWQRSLNEGYRA